jgi:hypothetical protein
MEQPKSDCRFGHGWPAALSTAKSAEAEKAGAMQHSAKQRPQSARSLWRYPLIVRHILWEIPGPTPVSWVCGGQGDHLPTVKVGFQKLSGQRKTEMKY